MSRHMYFIIGRERVPSTSCRLIQVISKRWLHPFLADSLITFWPVRLVVYSVFWGLIEMSERELAHTCSSRNQIVCQERSCTCSVTSALPLPRWWSPSDSFSWQTYNREKIRGNKGRFHSSTLLVCHFSVASLSNGNRIGKSRFPRWNPCNTTFQCFSFEQVTTAVQPSTVEPASQDDDYELRIQSCTTVHIPNTLRITVVFLRNTWLSITIVNLQFVHKRFPKNLMAIVCSDVRTDLFVCIRIRS